MKKQYFISFFICLFICKSLNAQNKFFDAYRPLADSLAAAYQIPASVILAVAYQESGGGTSVVGRRLNNHFGLKGRVVGGDTVSVKSSYKYFEKPGDSYIYFCNLVARKKFYPSLKGTTEYKKWVIAISKTGYAGNAKVWSKHIIGVIEKYKLDK
jgi:flagellum-specific peptidoglycan hydrolase FlgJ